MAEDWRLKSNVLHRLVGASRGAAHCLVEVARRYAPPAMVHRE